MNTFYTRFLLPSYTLTQREIIRFYRQKSRIIGTLLPPLIFWFFIGSGLGDVFQNQSSYLNYFFPGMILLIVLFTAIFSTISIIEDRREGFLQSVIVAPIYRSSIVFGKILGGTLLAFLQALIFIILMPFLGIPYNVGSLLFSLTTLFILAFGLTGLGFLIAWKMDSTQGFHSIMNLFLMPMWFLSGALFPIESAPTWLKWIMTLNPLTYGIIALRHSFNGQELGPNQTIVGPAACIGILILFCCIMFMSSLVISNQKE